MKIRKKPVVVDAWYIDTAELQYHGDVIDWVHEEYQKNNGRLAVASDGKEMILRIRTLEGIMTAKDGDVLVKGVDGELYAIKRDIFAKTYDVLDDFNEKPIDPSAWSGDFEYDTGLPIPPAKTKHINVYEIEDLSDGTAIVRMDMDYDTMKSFAKRGLYAAIKEAAENIVKEHGDA